MSAPPPEADTEYSRGPRLSRDLSGPLRGRLKASARAPAAVPSSGVRAVIVAGGAVGAALLLGAEFATLFAVTTPASRAPLKSVSTGSHHSYALIPIACLTVALAVAVWRSGSRSALLAIGLLGVVTLLIALLGDLPDAHATGLVLARGHYAQASSSPRAGLYLETLGGMLLLITSVCGLLMLGPPTPAPSAQTSPSVSRTD